MISRLSALATFLLGLAILVIFSCIAYFCSLLEKGKRTKGRQGESHRLNRVAKNPILSPRSHLSWESEGVFNPAAVQIGDRVHLLYRAVGSDGISRVGYASSADGMDFGAGDTYPAFSFEKNAPLRPGQKYDPVMYPSGGSCGGCEDPRITKIGDTVYMTFNAFDGWDFIRIGLTMISEKDFLKKRWGAWTKPVLLSPPGQIHKNWMIFPEKVNGKFAILHSISPKVEIEYRRDLSSVGITSPFVMSPVGARGAGRKGSWDTRIRGAGAPPLRTDRGWLVLYHANDERESHKYKLGAMLLDLNDPTKVIAQSSLPVLEPDSWYENDGKPGIVYACGAIIREHGGEDSLFVYYGGGDRHVCAAHAKLRPLLDWIVSHGSLAGK